MQARRANEPKQPHWGSAWQSEDRDCGQLALSEGGFNISKRRRLEHVAPLARVREREKAGCV